ncbi:unnamed protein product [Psylliodes chrysocephalus]|uniref:Uncharacterized protein n=1 Tax=Psylliodes chrysocephalus TaxID=3402493 RepID=A0A9P0GB99_9CUCU|nr:unnamed protein product [Psylliodes chrysocephala]
MWHLVRFEDDGIIYVCPPTRITISKSETLVKWPQDGKWYKADILATGERKRMIELKSTTIKPELNDSQQDIIESSNKEEVQIILNKAEVQQTEDRKLGNTHKTEESQSLLPDRSTDVPRTWRKFCNAPLGDSFCLSEKTVSSDNTTCNDMSTDNHNNSVVLKELSTVEQTICQTVDTQNFQFTIKDDNQNDEAPQLSLSTANHYDNSLFIGELKGIPIVEQVESTIVSSKDSPEIISPTSQLSDVLFIEKPKSLTVLTNVYSSEPDVYVNRYSEQISKSTEEYSLRKYLKRKPNVTDSEGVGSDEEVFAEEDSEYAPSDSDNSDNFDILRQIRKKKKENSFFNAKNLLTDESVHEKPHRISENISKNVENSCHLSIVNPHEIQTFTSLETANIDQERVFDMPILAIAATDNSQKRKWNKNFFCIFCKKQFAKLPRHFYNCHADELEIAKIQALDKNSIERKKMLQSLQNQGAFVMNKDTIIKGEGTIVPKRRINPSDLKTATDYLPCSYCYQMFSKSYLSRHTKKCNFGHNLQGETSTFKSRGVQTISSLLLPIGPNTSQRFRDCILSKMNTDDIFEAVRKDPLILLFAQTEFRRLGHETRYHRNIIDRSRELGRLLLAVKEIDPKLQKLSQLLNPSGYKTFREAVCKIAGYNDVTNAFQVPSLALKIGFTIKKCVSILKGDYLEDETLRSTIPILDAFVEVLESKWTVDVTCHAQRTLSERKWNKAKRVPLTKDIQILHKYLSSQSKKLLDILSLKSDITAFRELTELSLAMIIILNRRRVGEVQYMTKEDYLKAKAGDPESDTFKILSDTERKLAESLTRIVIKGKRGRGVPVLLTEEIKHQIDVLNNMRETCGVDLLNPYLFPSLRHTCGYYRAYNLLSKFAQVAGCAHPETITSTKLRKHVATAVQLLNLKENELDSLATFMGHDIRVHR